MFRCFIAMLLCSITVESFSPPAHAEWQGSNIAICAGHEAHVGLNTTLNTNAMAIATPMNGAETTWFLSTGLKYPFVSDPMWLTTKLGVILNWNGNDCPFAELELSMVTKSLFASIDTYHIRLPDGDPDYLGFYQLGRNVGGWRFGGQVKQANVNFFYGPSVSYGERDWRATVRYFSDGEGGNNALFVLSYR